VRRHDRLNTHDRVAGSAGGDRAGVARSTDGAPHLQGASPGGSPRGEPARFPQGRAREVPPGASPGGSPRGSPHLPDTEASEALRLLIAHLDRLDASSTWASAGEGDEAVDGVPVAFAHRLPRPVATVGHPPGNVVLLREPPHRVAEEHALDLTVDDDAATDHRAYSRAVDFKDTLRRRRMVRAYEPEPIPRAAIERIVGTVRRAPSAGFSQGQRLLVITEAETRRRIAQLLEENNPMRGRAPKNDRWIRAAPVLIVVG